MEMERKCRDRGNGEEDKDLKWYDMRERGERENVKGQTVIYSSSNNMITGM